VILNQAKPSRRFFRLIGQLVKAASREARPPGTRMALTLEAEKAFTSVLAKLVDRSTSFMPKRRSGLSVP